MLRLSREIWLRLIDEFAPRERSLHEHSKRRIEGSDPFRHAPQLFGTSINAALAGSATFSFVSHEDISSASAAPPPANQCGRCAELRSVHLGLRLFPPADHKTRGSPAAVRSA